MYRISIIISNAQIYCVIKKKEKKKKKKEEEVEED
jgi:hypothetical protein